MRTLCEHDFAALTEASLQTLQISDPIGRIQQMGLIYIDFAVKHPSQYRLMFMNPLPVAPTAEALSHKGDPLYDSYATLKKAVEDATAGGYLRPEYSDPELVAQILWAGVHGIASLHIVMADDPWLDWRPLQARAEGMVDVLLRGLLAKAGQATVQA